MRTRRGWCSGIPALAAAALLAGAPLVAHAQTGDGTTTAAVLQLPAGARAAAMGGAYVAGRDADAVFYNPAAAAWQRRSASLAYQRHAEEIGFGTVAAAARVGPGAFALAFGFLDYGSIAEVVPDPAFGGHRGEQTGAMLRAGELVGRVLIAGSALDDRLAVGLAAGLLWVGIAETGRPASIFDGGVLYALRPDLALGAAIRNAGGPLDGARLGAAELPTELRLGGRYQPASGIHGAAVALHADVVLPTGGGSSALAAGIEAALPTAAGGPVAAVRAGWNGVVGTGGTGRLTAGAGLSLSAFSLDYGVQSMGVLGVVHRVGVRWSRQ